MQAPSGEQWRIAAHDQELVVTEIGGGIRTYRAHGRDALFGYPEHAKADAGRGQVLMPWPNRIRDGKYTFDGKEQQLPLSEPARGNASHGLVRWVPWTLQDRTDESVTVGFRLRPQAGWDWLLDLTVTYVLTEDGLVVVPAATNVGDKVAPFGYGAHPYLTAGEERVDDLDLTFAADTMLTVDERLLPVGATLVPPDMDHTSRAPIGDTQFDHAFTDLATDGGVWTVRVEHGARSTTLWADADTFGFVQLFTGDSLPDGKARRTGLAVEPMTCPADAFRTGTGLVRIEPGETWRGRWGVTAS